MAPKSSKRIKYEARARAICSKLGDSDDAKFLRWYMNKMQESIDYKDKGWRESNAELTEANGRIVSTKTELVAIQQDLESEQQKLAVANRTIQVMKKEKAADEKRHQKELQEVKTQCTELRRQAADIEWSIDANQLAEGSREHFCVRVWDAMPAELRLRVPNGKESSLASLVQIALSRPQRMDIQKLGFPVRELRIISDGFQIVSNRRTKLTHPTARLLYATTPEDTSKAFVRLWGEVTCGQRVSRELCAVLQESQEASLDKMRSKYEKRDAYESSPLAHAVTQRRNLALVHSHEIRKDGKGLVHKQKRTSYATRAPKRQRLCSPAPRNLK